MQSEVSTKGWAVPAGLLALVLIPLAAGGARLAGLASGKVTAGSARFFAAPAPVVVHIVGASVFCLLGVLQVWAAFRRRSPRWHRAAGWVAIPAGAAAALSGLWMTLFYPRVPLDGPALDGLRLLFGAGMVAALGLGVAAIIRRDFAAHGAWMLRAYAIGLGAGTQAVTQLPWILLVGLPGEGPRAALMGGAWALNLAVAEWVIRRSARRGSEPDRGQDEGLEASGRGVSVRGLRHARQPAPCLLRRQGIDQ